MKSKTHFDLFIRYLVKFLQGVEVFIMDWFWFQVVGNACLLIIY